ncbi:hypothetical protein AB0O34_36240 [Sphaerisporangium sp. NPDC088356]|uniref:hypothetical protein n=1 Tax=Sphaerisporangium sp. NPDC088356 TaxID=3154871 RepID=UPI0034125771
MKFLGGLARFWYDFIVGDDWKIAVAVVSALAVVLTALLLAGLSGTAAAVLGGVLLAGFFVISVVVDVRRS